ncbi:MAG TPA: IMP dehydrogenase [Myxococcales bacterium LLY-WYZ-16_1]|jgi:IMP dehydrogenase|nr:IMP dehydrogenase [Myxococcales bacterium LLY-WYZ-16_1]
MNAPPVAEGLAFDDVLLVPGYSETLPRDVSIDTRFSRKLHLRVPLVSAAMDTVTEARMAIALAQLGGIGVVHKNMTVEAQAQEVRKVKRFEAGIISDPVAVAPDDPVRRALDLKGELGFSSFPVVEGGRLVGILTGRDIRAAAPDDRVRQRMTPDPVTVRAGTSPDRAREVMHEHRKETLPIVDVDGALVGLMTLKDVEKSARHPNAVTDDRGRLLVAAAAGVGPDREARIEALVGAEVDAVVVDTAHGHTRGVLDTVRWTKAQFPHVQVVAGNVATREGTLALAEAGVDGVKIGIGPGSICTTRIVAGVGVPQLTAILECSAAARERDLPIIGDGGIKYSGDVVKALAAGAESVMVGSLLAGVTESPGEVVLYEGRAFKSYRGMGSLGAMQQGSSDRYAQAGVKAQKLVPEGIEGRVPFKGPLDETVWQLVGGLRAGMGYVGATDLMSLRSQARFVKITAAGLRESHVHDVVITNEAPNYSR